MSETGFCPKCGLRLAANAPRGMCPACLLREALDSQLSPATTLPRGEIDGGQIPTPEDLAAEFPDLEILELIGRGGMGIVYKARQISLDRLVALKILSPAISRDRAFAERISREARVLALLAHPHVIAVYNFGTTTPREESQSPVPFYYFLMEYVDGLNLRQLQASGKLTPAQALTIVPQICEALQYAHNKGVVHRDIKPENILVDRQGNVKIADFGLAKLLGFDPHEVTLSVTGQVLGTLHYMAPEQMERPNQVDHRADIYSLGVVFYQMLTGELPLGRFEPPSQRVVVDARLDEVVLRALEREPERRYQQASTLQSQVESIASTVGRIEAGMTNPQPRAKRPILRGLKWLTVSVAALLVFGFAGLSAWQLVGQRLWQAFQRNSKSPEVLANSPHDLRYAATPLVIQAGLTKPISPWAWQELERRRLTPADAESVMNGLTEWLRRDHPHGMSDHLAWLDQFLKYLNDKNLLTDTQKLDFRELLEGELWGAKVVRFREGKAGWTWNTDVHWRRTWDGDLFDLTMMNELQSVTVDGNPLEIGSEQHPNWSWDSLHRSLRLPELAVGKHEIALTVTTSLVRSTDLLGLKMDAPSSDWPRAVKKWTRSWQTELIVFAADAEILPGVRDPQRSPAKGGLTIEPIVVRNSQDGLNAVLEFKIQAALSVPIAFDVILKAGEQTIPCGNLWGFHFDPQQSTENDNRPRRAGMSGTTMFSVKLAPLPANVTTADVVLTPNPSLIELNSYADSYWAEEIVLKKVPLRRVN